MKRNYKNLKKEENGEKKILIFFSYKPAVNLKCAYKYLNPYFFG